VQRTNVAGSSVSGFKDLLAQFDAVAGKAYEGTHELETSLRGLYSTLFETGFANADPAEVAAAAPRLMHDLFAARMRMRDRIGEWQAAGIFARPAEIALRNVFRIARNASDMLGEIASGNARLAPGEKSTRGFSARPGTLSSTRPTQTAATFPFSRATSSSCAAAPTTAPPSRASATSTASSATSPSST
jgi:hypothetical protein